MSEYIAGETLKAGELVYCGGDGKLYGFHGTQGSHRAVMAPRDMRRGDVLEIESELGPVPSSPETVPSDLVNDVMRMDSDKG